MIVYNLHLWKSGCSHCNTLTDFWRFSFWNLALFIFYLCQWNIQFLQSHFISHVLQMLIMIGTWFVDVSVRKVGYRHGVIESFGRGMESSSCVTTRIPSCASVTTNLFLPSLTWRSVHEISQGHHVDWKVSSFLEKKSKKMWGGGKIRWKESLRLPDFIIFLHANYSSTIFSGLCVTEYSNVQTAVYSSKPVYWSTDITEVYNWNTEVYLFSWRCSGTMILMCLCVCTRVLVCVL